MGIKEALSFGFNPPPIQGLGTTGGFEGYVQAAASATTARLAEVTQQLLGELNQDPRLLGVRTLFRADSPQLGVRLDRAKAKALGVPVDSVFSTLQAAFGSMYVNDFDRAGRVYRVQVQAEPRVPRRGPRISAGSGCAPRSGEMVPLATLIDARATRRAPRRSSATTSIPRSSSSARPAIGRSSSEAIAAVEEVADARAAAGLRHRLDRLGVRGEEERRHLAQRAALRHGVRLPDPRRAVREVDAAGGGAAGGAVRAASAPWSRSGCAACRTTSTSRSGSSRSSVWRRRTPS